MKFGTLRTIALLLAACVWLSGCDIVKDAFNRRSSDGGKDGRTPEEIEGFFVDEDGNSRLMPPDDLQQRHGKEVSTKELATDGASSTLGHGWIGKASSKPGSFLLASPSKAGSVGGDMIRRIDLSGTIKEFDYDSDTKGAQGAYIYVPDEMRDAVPSKYVDADGLFSGIICAFVPGPEKTIVALAGGTDGGVGFVLNPYEEANAFTPLQAFKMPYASNPCRAVYSETNKKLYVIDVARTESQGGQNGIFVADIYQDKRGSIASFYSFDPKYRINSHSMNNFQGVELYKDMLYLLSGNGRFDSEWDAVVYSVPLNKAGEPLFEELKYTRTNNPIVRTDGCAISSWNIGAISIVEQKDKAILLTSGTQSIIAWEIQDSGELKKIDLNEKRPGIQGINLEDNGQGGLKFEFSPDGKHLYLLPHCRSNQNKVKLGNSLDMLAFNITSLSVPALQAEDPVDIAYKNLLISLKDAAYRPQFSMNTRDFAVGRDHIAVLGSSASNLSGLGAGADVSIIDRAKKSNISFSMPKDMRKAHESKYGFKLAKDDPKFGNAELNSHAVIWIP